MKLNKEPEKHLIFSTERDFTSSDDIDTYALSTIANGGILFGRVINVPNKVEGEYDNSVEGHFSKEKKYIKDFANTHCNYRKNLGRNLRELEGMNGSIGWDRNSFEKIFLDSDDGTGKNPHEDFEKFGKVKSYSKDEIGELKKKYKQTIMKNVAWTATKAGSVGGAVIAGVTLGGFPFVLRAALFGVVTAVELVRGSDPDSSLKIIRGAVNKSGSVKEKVGDLAEAGRDLVVNTGKAVVSTGKAVVSTGKAVSRKVVNAGKTVMDGIENVLGKKRGRDN